MEQGFVKQHSGTVGNQFSRRRLGLLAAFYIGIPVALALNSGAAESGSAAFIEKRYYFFYFLVASVPAWIAFDVCTRGVQWLLKPWQPPLVLILVLGAILGLHLQGLWAPWRQSLFEPYLAEGSSFYSVFPWRYDEADYLIKALIAWSMAGAVWASANLLFLHLFGLPRYGHTAAHVAESSPAHEDTAHGENTGLEPDSLLKARILLDKLPETLGTDIVALKAEEHYTRVYTTLGETLILMRFSDAVELLEDLNGLQTHRSYWANPRFIEEIVNEGRSDRLRLSTGLDIPVSRTYRVKVREALA